jgi:uracil-DNA glycosylase
MASHDSADRFLPSDRTDLDALRQASRGCRGCPLYQRATQTVFGTGSAGSSLMLVGEVPGNQEDRAGEPFVGPAGRLLRTSMEAADLVPEDAYLTNAVKHFKFEQRGKLRLHKKPSASEVAACAPWLHAEIEAVRPQLVVALGATAGQALLGPSLRVTRDRGSVFDGPGGVRVLATVHPSSILRSRDQDGRARATDHFVADLVAARRFVAG